jgi:hypothetical protein
MALINCGCSLLLLLLLRLLLVLLLRLLLVAVARCCCSRASPPLRCLAAGRSCRLSFDVPSSSGLIPDVTNDDLIN